MARAANWPVSIAQARPFLFRPRGSRAETGTWKQFQSLKRDHSSSDKAKRRFITSFMYKFQSLKRDHSSSDPVSRENRRISSTVSIAQARPFLFRPRRAGTLKQGVLSYVSIAQARPFLFRLLAQRVQELEQSYVSIAQARPFLFRPVSPVSVTISSMCVSIAQARPFLFRPPFSEDSIQSAEVSIAQARPFLFRPVRLRRLAPGLYVSIAQARPFLFRPELHHLVLAVAIGFNRSSATIPLPTSRSARWKLSSWLKFQSLKRDHSSSDGSPLR